MKKISFIIIGVCFALVTWAQQREGKVIYSRTAQMQIRLNNDNPMQHLLPKSRTDKFELTFGNNQSLWKNVEEDNNTSEMSEGGMQVRMVVQSYETITMAYYINGYNTDYNYRFPGLLVKGKL